MPPRNLRLDGLWQCLCPAIGLRSTRRLIKRHIIIAPSLRSERTARFHGHQQQRTFTRLSVHAQALAVVKDAAPLGPRTDDAGYGNPILRESSSTNDLYRHLRRMALRGHTKDVDSLVHYLLQQRKEPPNTRMYNALILANVNPDCGIAGRAEALLEELKLKDLNPDSVTYHDLLKVCSSTARRNSHGLNRDFCRYFRSTLTMSFAVKS